MPKESLDLSMPLISFENEDRSQLESKILAEALRQSQELADQVGANLAQDELTKMQTEHGKYSPQPSDVYAIVDFGEDEEPKNPKVSTGPLTGRPLPDPDAQTYYEQIAAERTDSFYIIRLCYLRAVRLLLRKQYLDEKSQSINIHEFRRQLKNLGIAYQLLSVASTRADYDLRLLGLRVPLSGQGLSVPEDAQACALGGKIGLLAEELFLLAKVLDMGSIKAARSSTDFISQESLWESLAAQVQLTEKENEALAVGYTLIANGLITVMQFEQAFQAVSLSHEGLIEILLQAGWLDAETYNDFFFAVQNENKSESPQITEIVLTNEQVAPAEPGLNLSRAVPSWVAEMDWGDSEVLSPPVCEPKALPEPGKKASRKSKSNTKRKRSSKRSKK